jgi:hypothetical protein
MIGAVTSNRCSRDDTAPHAKISAATMAKSEILISSPAPQHGGAVGRIGRIGSA